MKLVLVMEIALFVAAFIVLHRALRRRVDEAVRWEVSVALEMNRPARRAAPRPRVAAEDETAADRVNRGDYRSDRVQPAVL